MMATTNDVRLIDWPKNRTGVFVGRDIHSQRSISRTRLILSARQRMQPVTSNKSTFFSSPNHHHETFPPWIIHSQKIRQENKSNVTRNVSSRSSCYPSAASAKLKSEIDYIQKKYRIQTDLYQKLSSAEKQDLSVLTASVLSSTNSGRLSSASTSQTASRLTRRAPSAETQPTLASLLTIPTLTNSPAEGQLVESETSSEITVQPTHAYQIPRSANLNTETVLNARKNPKRKQTANAQPFYVMYFANLTNSQTPLLPDSSRTTPRSNSKPNKTRSSTSYSEHKRLSANINAFERENSVLLKDLLRTTAWNHLKI